MSLPFGLEESKELKALIRLVLGYFNVRNVRRKMISRFTKTAKFFSFCGIKFHGSCIRANFMGI